MRLPDDLHQRHTGPVAIDQADLDAVRVHAVDEPAGVLLDVDASDSGPPHRAPGNELEMSIDRQREIELRDLIPLRQIRIKVVLAIELAEWRDRAIERHPGQDRGIDSRLVQHRQSDTETT